MIYYCSFFYIFRLSRWTML